MAGQIRRSLASQAIALGLLGSCASNDPINATSSILAADSTFANDLAASQVLIIGETHGTNEIPTFVADLSHTLPGRTLFAFELSSDTTPLDCDRMIPPPGWRNINDGRTSPAMLAAICAVKKVKPKSRADAIFIDDRPAGNATFYAGASRTIIAQLSSGKFDRVVVLAGNYHARNAESALASLLRRAGLKVVTATASSPVPGEAWQCQGADLGICKVYTVQLDFCPGQNPNKPLWTSNVPSGFRWDRCLIFPKLTASISSSDSRP